MRTNLPITDREFAFPPGETLVSTTDLQGRILYCNPAFIHVSGYTRDELLGQPHNMIRHPDMPEEAFRDMWATISSGQPWSALVKNRRKDGTYYWVRANVTPLMSGTQPEGYMSVRTQASREEIQAASALYAQLRQEHAQGQVKHRLAHGAVVRADWLGQLLRVFKLDMVGQLALSGSILGSLCFIAGMVAAEGWAAVTPT
jgi:aerotaxis receptor